MGRGAKENSSGSLPWGRGAHREGVRLVTEMTFTESWPALQSSRAPPTHTHTVPTGLPSPWGLCSGKRCVGSGLPWLLSPPRLPTQITTTHPCASSLPSEYSALPSLGPQWPPRPSIFGKHGRYSPVPPAPVFPPGGRSRLAAASAWAWGSAAAHPPPCSRALVGTLRTFVPRDPSLVPLSRPGYLLASRLAAVKGRLSSHHL